MMTDEKRRPKQGLHTRTETMPAIQEVMDRFRRPGPITILPSEVDVQRKLFRNRLRAIWDWFRLSVVLAGYVTILMIGGIFITRLIIFLWEEVLGEYFGK